MRERSIIWDILVVGFLFLLVLFNGIFLLQNNNLEKTNKENTKAISALSGQNNSLNKKIDSLSTDLKQSQAETQALLKDIQARGVTVKTGGGGTSVESPGNSTQVKHSKSYFDETMLPKWKIGDEKADNGDQLIFNEKAEPNSLNPLIDNDATGADLFDLCNDKLASKSFDDLTYFQPLLARGWEKAMICRAVTAKKNAGELADKLNKQFDDAAKEKLQISKISAENDEILRIELFDASGSYREPVMTALGTTAIKRQHWLYVNFEGERFADGKDLNAGTVAALVRDALKNTPAFKGEFLPDWERENSVVIRVLGEDTVGKAAEDAINALIASDKNKGEITDPKSPTGKSIKKVITLDLVEKYDFEEKPVFTFYLRKGVKWHDGEAFTGKDVIFSFNTMMSPKVECAPSRNYFQDCESVQLVDNDPYVVRFTWKKPYFLSFEFSAEMYLFPEHVFKYNDPAEFNKTDKNQWIVGTGAYKVERWARKEQIIFTRNDEYWGPKPHFNKLVSKFVPDPTVSLQMLKKHDLDIEEYLTKSQTKQLLDDKEFRKNFNFEISVADSYSYLGWNIRRPIFASIKTRRALTMLVDRQRIIDTIKRGFAKPLDAPTHPDSPSFPKNPDRLKIPFDIEGAKKLLAEDGWADSDRDNVLDKMIDGKRVPFKFTLLVYSGNTESISIAGLIKDTFAQAGIEVTISNLEWSVMMQNIERLNFDASMGGWRVGTSDDPYQLWHSSQGVEKGSNHTGYNNKDVDRWIVDGRRELNDERRNEIFRKVYEKIAEEQPYTNLYVGMRTVGYSNRIQNVVYKLNGKDLTRWYVPKEMQRVK